MMGPSHFGGGIGAKTFGVNGLVRGFSFDAQPFVSFSLAFSAASARIRSPEIARSVGIAPTSQLGLVGLAAFRVPIDIGLALGRRIGATGWLAGWATSIRLLALALPWIFFPRCHFR